MYVLFFGTDRGGARDAVADYVENNLPQDGTLTTIDADSYQSGQVQDCLGASSLFGGAEWFLLDTPSAQADFAEETKNSLQELAESPNTFLILEGSLLAPAKKAFNKHTDQMHEFVADKAERFNAFAVAEALANKDKKRLWLLLQEAKLNGLREEEIVGMLWWQLKSLRLASATRSASEAGMKDFPYNKAKRSLSKFSPGELERLSQSLLEVYHDGHAGVREMDLALEEWSLSM